MKKPLILMILDGFGIAPEKGNAIKAANKPNIDKLLVPRSGCMEGRRRAFIRSVSE